MSITDFLKKKCIICTKPTDNKMVLDEAIQIYICKECEDIVNSLPDMAIGSTEEVNIEDIFDNLESML